MKCVNSLCDKAFSSKTGREVSSVDFDTRSGKRRSSMDFRLLDSNTTDPAVYRSTGSPPVPFSMSNPKGL